MLIEVTNLKKTYQLGDIEVPAVRGIDMSIEKNEYILRTFPGCGLCKVIVAAVG